MHVPKRNALQEYRQKQRERLDASPVIATKFPRIKSLTVNLEYFDVSGTKKNGETKCKLNVEHAKSLLLFGCPRRECTGGDFDLSAALAEAVSGRKKTISGELPCLGKRKRADNQQVPCPTLLRYKLSLNYERS